MDCGLLNINKLAVSAGAVRPLIGGGMREHVKGHRALIRWHIITPLPALHSFRNSISPQPRSIIRRYNCTAFETVHQQWRRWWWWNICGTTVSDRTKWDLPLNLERAANSTPGQRLSKAGDEHQTPWAKRTDRASSSNDFVEPRSKNGLQSASCIELLLTKEVPVCSDTWGRSDTWLTGIPWMWVFYPHAQLGRWRRLLMTPSVTSKQCNQTLQTRAQADIKHLTVVL